MGFSCVALREMEARYVCLFGGADGIRTHDLLDAIEARSQLRHGPTELVKFTTGISVSKAMRYLGYQNPGGQSKSAWKVVWRRSIADLTD
jgi:hypothetical protein